MNLFTQVNYIMQNVKTIFSQLFGKDDCLQILAFCGSFLYLGDKLCFEIGACPNDTMTNTR